MQVVIEFNNIFRSKAHQKFTQIGIFCVKIYRLATLVVRETKRETGKSSIFGVRFMHTWLGPQSHKGMRKGLIILGR
jgi:hypothetical protein